MARVAWNEFSHHDRRTENLQQQLRYYIVFNGAERKEKGKMFENRPDIRDNWNFPMIIGDALKIIEETNRRIESLLMFTNIGKMAEKLFLRMLLKSNILFAEQSKRKWFFR